MTFTVKTGAPKSGYFFNKKMFKVNIRPIGENSPNLVTLLQFRKWAGTFRKSGKRSYE
jgi:hypothetical protein